MMKAYKIVRRIGEDRLVSGYVYDAVVRVYRLGRWTKVGRCGPLFCFRTLKDVQSFRVDWETGREVYLCEVVRPRRIKWCLVLRLHNATTYATMCMKFWASRNRDRFFEAMNTPDGTIVCDAIKLLKKIE